MAINSGNANDRSSNAVEIKIQARDEATEIIKDTRVALSKLKEESGLLLKSLSLAGESLKTVATTAVFVGAKLGDVTRGINDTGNAAVSAITGSVAALANLATFVGKVKQSLDNPVTNQLFTIIAADAEQALNRVAPLTDLLKDLRGIGSSVGEGFTQEIFNLDTRTTFEKVNDSIFDVSDNIKQAFSSAINNIFDLSPSELSFGESILKAIGIESAAVEAKEKARESIEDLKDSINGYLVSLDNGISSYITNIVFETAIEDERLREIFSPLIGGIVNVLPSSLKDALSLSLDSPVKSFISDFARGISSDKNISLVKASFNRLLENPFVDTTAISEKAGDVFSVIQKALNPPRNPLLNLLKQSGFDGKGLIGKLLGDTSDLNVVEKTLFNLAKFKGGALSKPVVGGAELVDNLIGFTGFSAKRVVAGRVVDSIRDSIGQELERSGTTAIANILGEAFGSSKIGSAISNSLINSGLPKEIFSALSSLLDPRVIIDQLKNVLSQLNIQPAFDAVLKLEQSLSGLDRQIARIFESIKSGILSANKGAINLLKDANGFLESIKINSSSNAVNTGINSLISTVQDRISRGIDTLNLLQRQAGRDFASGFIRNLALNIASENSTSLVKVSFSDLLNRSFTDALTISYGKRIGKQAESIFGAIQAPLNSVSNRLGSSLANLLIDGQDEEKIKRGTAIVGNLTEGLSARFLKGAEIEGGGLIGKLLLGTAGNAVDNLLFKGARFGVNRVIDSLQQEIEVRGSNAIAKAFGKMFGSSEIGEIVSSALIQTGLSKQIFGYLASFINPTKLVSGLKGLSSGLGNLKDGFTNANSFIDSTAITVLSKLQNFALSIPGKINQIQPAISNLLTKLGDGLKDIDLKIIGIFEAINKAVAFAANGSINLLTNVNKFLDSLKANTSSPAIASFVTSLQSGIDKAIQAIGFLQQKIRSISDIGLLNILGGTENLQFFLLDIDDFVQNIGPRTQALITNIFNSAIAQVGKLSSGVQDLIGNVISGLDSLRQGIPGFTEGLFKGIQSGSDGIFEFVDQLRVGLVVALQGASNGQGGFLDSLAESIADARLPLKDFQDSVNSVINSSKDFADEIGTNFAFAILELQDNLAIGQGEIEKFGRSLQDSISGTLQSIIGGAPDFIPNLVIGIYDTIGGVLDNVVQNGVISDDLKNQFYGFVDTARRAISDVIPIIESITPFLIKQGEKLRDFLRDNLGNVAQVAGKAFGAVFPIIEGIFGSGQAAGFLAPFTRTIGQLFLTTGQQAARSFASGFIGQVFDRISPALNLIDQAILNTFETLGSVASRTSEALDRISLLPGNFAGFGEPLKVFSYLENLVGGVANGVSFLTERLTFFTQGLSSIQQLAENGPFKLLIGQNVELREQLLATQSSLVGTSAIFNKFTGQEIKDPTAAIKSLDLPILNQIEQLRKESLDLVGVTSKDLVPLYQQVASRITSIGGSLTDAKNLSVDFAASLGTLNIPLAQSQQEISSILTGQIDQNSALAKSLNITNEQVNLYKSQGRLVEELRKKLEAFRAGNKLAAQSLGGITSNIQEIFDEIGRKAGQPLLDPLLKQVGAVYKFLDDNQEQLIAYFQQFSSFFLRIGSAITQVFGQVGKSLQGLIVQAPIYLFKSLTNAIEAFSEAITFTIQVLEPVVNTLTAMAGAASSLGGPLLKVFLTTKALSSSVSILGDVFGTLVQLIPGLGDLMFLVDLRSQGLINQFTNLSKILNFGAAGFLLLGKNLESIPGAVGVLQQSFGPLGGTIASFIPTIAGVGIQLAGLIAIFPPIGAFLSNLLSLAPLALTSLSGFAAGSIYFAPLAPLFTQAADGLNLYANASTRGAVVSAQFSSVLKTVGKTIAANVVTLGLLTAGVYAAFVIFDNFVLKNETVKQILSAVGQGLATLGDIVKAVFGNPFTTAIAATALLGTTIAIGLIPPIKTLLLLQLGTWAGAAAGGLAALSNAAKLLGLTNLAASLLKSSVGLGIIQTLFTSGTSSAIMFAASNGIVVKSVSFLPPSLQLAAQKLFIFAQGLWEAIAPMLPVIATIALVVAAIAGIGLAVQKQKLAAGTAEVEEYGRQMENASDQTFKLAQNLKRAGDAQAEANKRGVQLTKEQYAENAKLLKQTELQKARLDDEIKNRQEALKDIPDANKAALQAQIDDLKKQQELLTRLSSDTIQTKPKEILDKGSAFEQLRIKIEGAKAAIKAPADDTALKQKSQELIEITQQQLELGAITSEEARKNLELVSGNAKLEQDVRIKAQKAIIESYKGTSRIEALKAEFDLINAQLAAGQLTFAENAKAIANIQNSALEDRMRNEESAHEETMKRLQNEYEGKKILLEQDLLSARLAAAQNIGTELGNQQLARAEEISKQLQQLEVSSNQERQNETKRNGEVTAAITQQIAENQAKQLKLAKELEKQVRDGSISEEQAALRQSSEAKKAELDAQLKASENAYRKQREIINQQFQQDRETAEKERRASIEAAAKAVPGSKEFQSSIQNAEAANSKIENSRKSTTQALLKAERDYLAEKSKLETQSLQVEADNEKKQREAAIKFFDTKQKQAQDVLQQSQNKQLINIQKLENAGLVIKEQTELSKTKATGERINNDLRQEQEKLKKLESLEKPKNQQERLSLDAQIRASRLKTQDLIREGLENEQKAYEGQISLVKANIQLENEAKETILEKQRLTLGEAAIAKTLARQKVTDLEKELALETKNKQRRSAIILELEKARTAVRNASIAKELNDFDNASTEIQARLESRYRNGQILQSRVRTIEAQEAVKRAQKEFDLEKDNVDKKYKLQLALEKAKTALLDAQIAERKELIETENQEYLNQIEEQNQAIKKQSMLYEVLTSALTERNKVLEASKNLAAAAAGYITTELDVLSKVETSEYRRKQLAEISAAIKLEALRKQQEFERQSLEIQIMQNKLALEREVIQNRINQSTKIAEIAKQQADIEAFKADSRNNSRSGRAQLRAKELALEANQFGLVQLGLQGGLIQQQLGNQDALADFQRRSLELKQKGEERQAQAELVNALPAGRKQRAARALKQQTLQDLGASSFQEFRDAGLAKSRGIIKKDLGITPSIDLLGAADPELAGLLENLSPSQQAAAIGGVGRTFNKEYGGTQSLSNVSSPNPTGKPLQLLPEFQGRLTLPSPNQRGSSIVSLEKSGNLFQTGVEKLINYLDDQKKTSKGTNYQITINSSSGSASTSGTGKTSSLEETLRIAKQLAGIK